MSVLVVSGEPFTLTSTWNTYYNPTTQQYEPTSAGATTATKDKYFSFSVPSDAVIQSARIIYTVNRKIEAGEQFISPTQPTIRTGQQRVIAHFGYKAKAQSFPTHRSGSDSIKVNAVLLRIVYTSESGSQATITPPSGTKKVQPQDGQTYTTYTTNTDITTDASAYRSCITIYEKDSDDWTTNGLGILNPSKCEQTEVAGGECEVQLQHPIDDDGRWKLLETERIIRCPVPIRQNPQMAIIAKQQGLTTHAIYKAKSVVNLRDRPASIKSNIIRKLTKGEQFEKIGASGGWYQVITSRGETGYLDGSYTQFVRDEETRQGTADGQTYNSVVTAQQTRNQCFRIYSVQTDAENRQVNVKARHISYDYASNLITQKIKATNMLLSKFLQTMRTNLAVEDDRQIKTDIINKYISGEWEFSNPVNVLLDPENGVVRQLQCQIIRDNLNFYILDNSTPPDRGYVISYGKNLTALKWTIDADEIVTRIMPTGADKKGNPLLLPEKFVDSTHITDYGVIRCSRLDVSAATVGSQYKDEITGQVVTKSLTEADCYELMRKAAQKELANGCDKPSVSVEVDFTQLEATQEYADYAGLYQLYLYDKVHIRHDKIGYSADAQVCETVFDCISGRYTKIKLGDIFKVESSSVAGYQISEGSVSGSRLVPSTITGTQIADATITNAKIGLACISAANISDINANTITAGTLTTDRLVVTGQASIAGQINTASSAAIEAGTADKNTVIGYIQNDALAVTDDGLVMKSGGKIQIVAGAEFTVDSANLDIDENGTLECRNASIKGNVYVNDSPVLTMDNITISTNAPAAPKDGMVWIRPAGGSTAATFTTETASRVLYSGVLQFSLNGSGAVYSANDARYTLSVPVYRGYASDNPYYLRATISDGVNTIDCGSYMLTKSSGVGNINVTLNASGAWVCSGNTVTLRTWMSSVQGGSSTMTFSSVGVAGGSVIKLVSTGAGGSAVGWQTCAVQYYQS